ncbi:sporulation integral membrane protein YlbJ [Clostridium ganghwense]|uniref:Sporulation integral membrane protein YlbJ n=1 Tax=Clostridium ganghwense TaxID=312089 RepID=A0ABT4CWV6_9CLOT|nr:sporulation integral membrane protein YlbJ [Clostridium ganghwense]MCY6372374.1 sporulation integral membrane protein YlbJ [Clostridium ganghwense]
MKILFLLILFTIIYLIFNLSKSISKNLGKNILFTIICSVLIIYITLNPELCLESALDGSKLFIKSVFVSLFPFLVLINIMLSYNAVNIYSKFFGNILCKPLRLPKNCSIVLIISIFCGYPLGAKYACDLYEKNLIDFRTCQRLVNIASNPSPIFVIGAVGTSMLNNSSLGFLLLLSCYLSCFITGIFLPSHTPSPYIKSSTNNYIYKERNIGNVLKESIDNALKSSFSIGGFIVFFSVISTIVKNNIISDIVFTKLSMVLGICIETLQSFLLGLLEMTNGCSLISSNNGLTILCKLILISFFLSFSGLSIIGQVYSIVYKFKISINNYIKVKLIQGTICSLLTVVLYKIDIIHISSTVFNINIENINFINHTSLFILCVLILISPFLITKFNKLFNRIS